jgi:hypothetical protein
VDSAAAGGYAYAACARLSAAMSPDHRRHHPYRFARYAAGPSTGSDRADTVRWKKQMVGLVVQHASALAAEALIGSYCARKK